MKLNRFFFKFKTNKNPSCNTSIELGVPGEINVSLAINICINYYYYRFISYTKVYNGTMSIRQKHEKV